MVLACAAVVEGNGQSEIGYRLFESVREAADRILHGEAIEVKSLPLLVVVVGQKFVLLHSTKTCQTRNFISLSKKKSASSDMAIHEGTCALCPPPDSNQSLPQQPVSC